MWYFTWILGLGAALAFGIINVMWLEASYTFGELDEDRIRERFKAPGDGGQRSELESGAMNARELVNYLAGLAENNNRAWFAMSKPSYDILRAEFTELVAQVIAATATFDPAVAGQDPKQALFRINRDLRFAKDKSPYKTHFAAAIAPGGKKDPGSHYYFHIDHRGMLLVAGGCYLPPVDVLAKIRTHIAKEPAKFKRLLGVPGLWSHFGAFADEGRLSRPPRGFAPDAPHIDYIKQKSFVVWTEERVKGKEGAALTKAITAGFKRSFPLIRWLREATAGVSSRT